MSHRSLSITVIAALGAAIIAWVPATLAQSTQPPTGTRTGTPWKSPTAAAADAQAAGKIKTVEHHSNRTIITLEDGTQLTLADAAAADQLALRPGMEVKASYNRQGAWNVLTGLEPQRGGTAVGGTAGPRAVAPWKSPTAMASDTPVSGRIRSVEHHSDRTIITLEDGTRLTMADTAAMDQLGLRAGMDVKGSYAKQGAWNVLTSLEPQRGAMAPGAPAESGAAASWKSPTAMASDTQVSGRIRSVEHHSNRTIITLEDGTQLTMTHKGPADQFGLRAGMDVKGSYAKQGAWNVLTSLEPRSR